MHIKKQQLEPDMEPWTGSKLGKEYVKAAHCHPVFIFIFFNLYAEYIMWNARLQESEAEIKIARGNISNLRYAVVTALMIECEEELKRL